ncbi:MAG: transglycosylase domain-containing protein [Anaerolineae bacterium]|nr:transglycosylase domain-containing protein [Anaerolineae bacterium]
MVILGVVAALTLVAGVVVYNWLFVDLPDIDALEESLALPSTRIYDRYGRLLYEMLAADATGGLHRVAPLDQIPQHLIDATIATEDANYYSHPGVDLGAIVRVLWINIQGGEVLAGGSTITQQVARNLLMDPEQRAERTLTRKLREAILAIRLTQTFSKDEVLLLYLNQTYYGNLAYGVEAAARVYFGRGVEELDLAQAALIAGLPQLPAIYDPLTNPGAARDRQRVVLDLMVKHGYITQADADRAAAEPLQFAAAPFPIEAPHFVAAVWTQLQRDFPESLYAGGLDVITTLDLDWQDAAQEIARRRLGELNTPTYNEPAHNAHNAALVAIDPHTGQVLAMLGSPDYFDARISGAVNVALAPRQPGSALKPFTYAAAFDPTRPDPWSPATVLMDIRTAFITKKLESFVPANFSLQEHGPVRIRTALASSFNIPAVITLDHIGLDAMAKRLGAVGITTLTDPDRFDLAVTLGGGEVRLLELTAAYGALANGGMRVYPDLLLEVRDHASGQILYEWAPRETERVLDERVAWLVTDILADNHARIPSFGEHSVLNILQPAAAKTGTTTDFRDNWTVGYTPNLVVGVWVGNADNAPMVKVTGVSGAGPIWNEFMTSVLKGKPALNFERPAGLERVEVCALSGLLPTDACELRVVDWFIEGTAPTEYDAWHQRFTIDARTGALADATTPPEYRVEKVYLVLPPEARPWAYRAGIPAPPTEAVAAAQDSNADTSVRFLAPDPYSVFRMSPITPGETQRILIRVVAPPDTSHVDLLLNGAPLHTLDAPPWEAWWALERGAWELTARAALGDGATAESEPLSFTVHGYYDE